MPAKREFLMLAHTYSEKKHGDSVVGWFMSEKLDGIRAFWDGGISRGVPAHEVPWANTLKDARLRVTPIATGLWSRRGNVIHAPDFFISQLPSFPLDGELLDGQSRQSTQSKISKHKPLDIEWEKIIYYVFESPTLTKVFAPGLYRADAKNTVEIDANWCKSFLDERIEKLPGIAIQHLDWAFSFKTFDEVCLNNEGWDYLTTSSPNFKFLKQEKINSLDEMYHKLASIREAGGEGIMLRRPESSYECKRSHNLLKLKNISFGEAEVIGYTTGRQTDRGSKLLGLMGSVSVKWRGAIFELSGFTEKERNLQFIETNGVGVSAHEWASINPDTYCPLGITNPLFPIGGKILFTYRGLTNDGIPNEGRYRRT